MVAVTAPVMIKMISMCVAIIWLSMKLDQRAHSNRKLRFQGFCRSIRLIERVYWSFYSTVRSDMQYWLALSWPYNLLSDKVLRITQVFELCHWFDQCDLNSFERSRSRVLPVWLDEPTQGELHVRSLSEPDPFPVELQVSCGICPQTAS